MRGRDEPAVPSTDRWERKDWWGVTLEAPDPHALLVFWSAILDKPIWNESERGGSLDFGEGVASLGGAEGRGLRAAGLAARAAASQGMQLHLEVEVSDLEAAVEHAVELGATGRSSSRRTTSGSCSIPPGIRSASTPT